MKAALRRLQRNVCIAGMLVILLSGINEVETVQAQDSNQNRQAAVHAMTLTQLQDRFYKVNIEAEISLDFQNLPLEQALREIALKSGLKLSYRSDIITDKKVTLKQERIGVSEALGNVLDNTGLDYKFSRDGYLLIGEPERVSDENVYQETIRGTVVDAQTGEALPGVNIVVEETTIGTTTDIDGGFEFNVPDLEETLIFSFVGYEMLEVEIMGRTELDIELMPDVQMLDDIVVIGYGTQRRETMTGAVSSVNAERMAEVKAVNASELVQGQLSGVHTRQSSGQPGADDVNINIRGFGNPLILVDGVERNLSDVDPESIESISVLKDASAAVYGARGGNGVVLVTTKRGEFDRPLQITYEGSFTGQQFTNKPRMITDAGEYLELWNEAETNVGLTPTYDQTEIESYKAGEPGYESYDWFDYTFHNFSPRHHQSLAVDGGGENISYYTNIGWSDQKGMVTSDDFNYQRYNIRANLDGRITDFLSVSLNFNYVTEEQTEPRETLWRDVYKTQPMAATHFPEPNQDLIPASNLVGTHQRLVGAMHRDIEGGWLRERDKIYGKVELKYEAPFLPGLGVRSVLDFVRNDSRITENHRQWEVYRQNPETGEVSFDGRFPAHITNSMLELQDQRMNRIKPRIDISYENNFGPHAVDGLLLAEYIEQNNNNFTSRTEDLLSEELELLFLGNPTFHFMDQFVQDVSRGSLVGRVQYTFDDKYLTEVTFRYDGSSMFPPDGRWGFFPSVSVGWRLSEESFMQISGLDELKVRASYSEMGFDQNAIPYDYFAGYNVNAIPPYLFGGQPFRRIQRGTLPNEQMTWEKMKLYNVGIDFSILQGKFSGMIEGFYRDRGDILARPVAALPTTFGASLPQQNLNSMNNKGIEVELTHNNNAGDFNYSITGNMTYSRAQWGHFEEEEFTTEDEIRVFQQSGRLVNRSVGYFSDGLFRSQQEIDNHDVDQDGAGNESLLPGDIKYVDLNGDGEIDFRDQGEIGYGTGMPELNFGLNLRSNYKGFGVSVLFQGASRYAGNISGLARSAFSNASTPLEVHRDHRFHLENNPDGSLPLLSMGDRDNNQRFSDFWLQDITYLRLKNVNISYEFPVRFTDPLGIRTLRIYATANNLKTFDTLGIWSNAFDPEAGLGHNGYPPHRNYTLGLILSF